MKAIFLLFVVLFSYHYSKAQNDKIVYEILRNIPFGCDIQKNDSLQEFAFSINVFIDIEKNHVDSFTITGNLPSTCNLSRVDFLARENRFLINYLKEKKINWKAFADSFGYKKCDSVILVFPHIIGTYDVKAELGSTYYRDFVIPYNKMAWSQSNCTILFSPIVTRLMQSVF
ncbi:hypothetical protein [Phnomibacter sp. MR]|uniref:hypothetical protein n=1 Tax=Phnomibacter sp. MR TaxID=3042318 RepID=UPI003A801C80